MELIETKELYENDAQEIALGLKNNLGDITKIRTIHRKQI